MKVLSDQRLKWLTEDEDDSLEDRFFRFPPQQRRSVNFPTSSLKERVLGWEADLPRPRVVPKPQTSIDSELAVLIGRLSVASRRELAQALKSPAIEVSEELWGAPPPLADVVRAALWHTQTSEARQLAVIGQSVPLDAAATVYDIDAEQLRQLAQEGAISTLTHKHVVWVPKWQFDESGRLIHGVGDLVSSFAGSATALALWVDRIHPDLGMTPLEAMNLGMATQVAYAATRGLETV